MRNFYLYSDELEGKALVDQIRLEEPDVPIVSHSQLGSWDRCEFQWYLGYVEQWTEQVPKSYLTLGSLGHEDLAVFYNALKDGASRDDAKELVRLTIAEHFNQYAFNDNALPMLAEEAWLVMKYIDQFSPAQDAEMQVVAVEEHFIIALWTPSGFKFYLQGYVDLRFLLRDQMWFMDHKFSGKFWYPNEVLMDSQQPLYAAAYRENGVDIFGTAINQLNTHEYVHKEKVGPEKLFKRDINYLSRIQLSNTMREVGYAVDDMIAKKAGHTVARRRLRRDCSRCWFQDPCLLSLKGHDINEIMLVSFKKKGEYSEESGDYDDEELNIHL